MMTLIRLFLAVALTGAAALHAGGELRFAIRSEPKTFHPAMVADENSDTIRYLTHGFLVRANRHTQELDPELAVSWKTSPDGRSIRFRLRTGVRFSDATPFTAEDVAHTLRALMDPELRSPVADSLRAGGRNLDVVAHSSHEVSVTFPKPMAGIESLFENVAILSARSPLKEKAVLGPFVLAEHVPGSYLLLKRNAHYWKKDKRGRALPYLDAVRVEIVQNRETELLKFRRNQLHFITNLEADHYSRLLAENPAWVKDTGPSLDVEMIWFNQVANAPIPAHKKTWFTSQAFRRAISMAINREDLCKVVYRGHARPAVGPFSAANRQWFNGSLKPHPFDVKAALKLLEQEGFQRKGEWLVDKTGQPVEFSIVTNSGSRNRERMAALVQQDLRAIGVRVNVVTLDFPSLIERISRNFNYEACLLGLVNVELDPNAQANVWLSSSSQHQWNPNQPTPATPWEAEIDRLMVAQATTMQQSKRKAHFDRVQEIVWQQAPFIYLINRNVLLAVSPELRNIAPSVLRPHVYWNVDSLELSGRTEVSRR